MLDDEGVVRLQGVGKEGNGQLFAETLLLKNNGTKHELIEVYPSLDLYKVQNFEKHNSKGWLFNINDGILRITNKNSTLQG